VKRVTRWTRVRNAARNQLHVWWPALLAVAVCTAGVVVFWDSPLPY